MAAILNSAILNSAILVFPLKLTHTCQDWFPPSAQKNLHSFILTQLDESSWQPSSLRFTQKTLSLHHSWLKLFFLNSAILNFSHLNFSSQTHSHLPRLVPTICTKKPSLIHSDSIWWGQPSWILPCWIKKTSLIHSDSTWWWQSSWILPCWIQTPCFLLSDSLKNTLTPLWLLTQTNLIWLKLIHSDSTWWWQPSWILPCWIKITSLLILTQFDDGSHLEFYHLGFRHLLIFSQIHSKTISLHSDSDSN